MKKFFILIFLLFSINVFAADSWEVPIKVKAANVEIRVIFGNNMSATDGFDGYYDVPFFGSGTLNAYFESDGGLLFKDVRRVQVTKNWTLKIENKQSDLKQLFIVWNSEKLPFGYSFTLVDTITGTKIDMKKDSFYQFPSTMIRYFDIEVQKN